MNYISTTEEERKEIFSAIGVHSLEDLITNVPKKTRFSSKNGILKNGISELETLTHLKSLASKNKTLEQQISFLGAGAYRHFIPSAIEPLISRGEFLTAYTPYQAEASQGTLQAIFEFQTMISELYGMDVANASMYDGASSLTEAALLAVRETGRNKILVSKTVHPEYRDTLKTYCKNYEILEVPYQNGVTSVSELEKMADENCACILIQTPNFFGSFEDGEKIGRIAREKGSLFIVSANPISLGIVIPPGDYGADIAVGEGQPFGIPLSFGGPYLGLFAAKEKFMRKTPGRIVGMTKDANGKRGFVLTLQTREQHIRREKATSNICSNEALMALAATVYLSLLGPDGLKEVGKLNLKKAHDAAESILKIPGFSLKFHSPFFNEFVIQSKIAPEKIRESLHQENIVGGLPLGQFYPELSDCTLYCATEMNSKSDIEQLTQILKSIAIN